MVQYLYDIRFSPVRKYFNSKCSFTYINCKKSYKLSLDQVLNTNMYHMEKESGKRMQTGGVGHLGWSHACSTGHWLVGDQKSQPYAPLGVASTCTCQTWASFHPLTSEGCKTNHISLPNLTLTPAKSPLFQKFNALWRLGK